MVVVMVAIMAVIMVVAMVVIMIVVVVMVGTVLVPPSRNHCTSIVNQIEPVQGDLSILDGRYQGFCWKETFCPLIKSCKLLRCCEVGATRQQDIGCFDLVLDLIALKVLLESSRVKQANHGAHIDRFTNTFSIEGVQNTR